MLNKKPLGYKPSTSRISLFILSKLMPLIISSNRVCVDYDNKYNELKDNEQHHIILAPPSLLHTVLILLSPSFHGGDSFRKGNWYLKKGDLTDFIEELYKEQQRWFFRHFKFVNDFKGLSFLLRQRWFVKYFTRKVKSHYDVDPDLYSIFLDKEMVYTCAFFEDINESLFDAQMKKLDTVIARMKLPESSSKVLEIGCGWGSLSRRIVTTNSQVSYEGLTIAEEQVKRAREIDLDRLTPSEISRINYNLEDYLDHNVVNNNLYDGIAVIGMMEHVGLGHYDVFLKKICSLLKSNRRAVIHTILAGESGKPTNRWVDKYIFQGGYAPSLAEISQAVEKCFCNIENVYVYEPDNYRLTIECWLENFLNNWNIFRSEKIDDWNDDEADELFRIWYFYLSAVRNMFVPTAMDFRIVHVVIKRA